jgi:hypothetical protein
VVAVPINPVIVRVVEAPTPETTVADILVGAFGIVGVILLAALVVGLIAGAGFIAFRKFRERRHGVDQAPSIAVSSLPR